jgi:hypothetical protein
MNIMENRKIFKQWFYGLISMKLKHTDEVQSIIRGFLSGKKLKNNSHPMSRDGDIESHESWMERVRLRRHIFRNIIKMMDKDTNNEFCLNNRNAVENNDYFALARFILMRINVNSTSPLDSCVMASDTEDVPCNATVEESSCSVDCTISNDHVDDDAVRCNGDEVAAASVDEVIICPCDMAAVSADDDIDTYTPIWSKKMIILNIFCVLGIFIWWALSLFDIPYRVHNHGSSSLHDLVPAPAAVVATPVSVDINSFIASGFELLSDPAGRLIANSDNNVFAHGSYVDSCYVPYVSESLKTNYIASLIAPWSGLCKIIHILYMYSYM